MRPVVEGGVEALPSGHPHPEVRAQLVTTRPVVSVTQTVGSKIGVYELSLLSSAYAEKLHANGATVLVGEEPVEAGHVRRGLGDEIARAC